jgi:hypothetical protein
LVRHGCARLQLDIARQIVGRSRGLGTQPSKISPKVRMRERVVYWDIQSLSEIRNSRSHL